MSALERLAHLLIQLPDRLHEIRAVQRARFALPLTQELLGDVLGLSTVHLNRTMQHLRRQRLIATECGPGRAPGRLRPRPPAPTPRRASA